MKLAYIYVVLLFSGGLIAAGINWNTAQGDQLLIKASGIRKIKDVIIYSDSSFHSAFPSIIRKHNGELMLAFRRAPNRRVFGESYTNHVDPTSQLMSVTSADGGNTWSKEPQLLYAYPFGGSQDPCLLQLKDGTLLCASYAWAFPRKEGFDALKKPYFAAGEGVFLGGYVLRSTDGGQHWGAPIYPPNIDAEINYNAFGKPLPAYNRGSMYEAADGRILWVVAATDATRKTSNYLLVSADKGSTWKYTGKVASDKTVAFNEASAYETPKGDIVAFLRTANFNDEACISRSSDGGRSFKWESMGFQGHPLHALRLADNRVLLTYGYRHKPYGIRARILNAECSDYKTAPEFIIREDGGATDLGYTWAIPISKDKYLVTYYFNLNNGTRHIAGSILQIPVHR
jgi:hypothetical protein